MEVITISWENHSPATVVDHLYHIMLFREKFRRGRIRAKNYANLFIIPFLYGNTPIGHRVRDRMLVGFMSIYAISAYHD